MLSIHIYIIERWLKFDLCISTNAQHDRVLNWSASGGEAAAGGGEGGKWYVFTFSMQKLNNVIKRAGKLCVCSSILRGVFH